jgi:glycosyltransferase involved in cell wall biosynthesis
MKALMLTPDEGHLDRRIAQEAATLALHGWQVDIHPAVDPGLTYEDDLPPGVRLLANPGLSTRAPSPGRRLLRQIKGVVTRLAPPAGRLIETVQYRTRDIAAEIVDANLSVLLGLGQYDLVFAHDVPVMPLAARLSAAWSAKLISDLHEVFPEQDEYFTSDTARRYWRALEGEGLAASDGIICVNPAVEAYVRATHAPRAPIAVVHNAVPYQPPDRLRGSRTLRSLYPISNGDRILLFAGSLRRHKGLEVLIDGFATAELEGWVLAILGGGPLRDDLAARIAGLGMGGRVFIGQRARERDLIQVAASADVALLPYQVVGFNYQIATPNKLFEYIQARLPIATSRLPEIERIVAPLGTAGFIDFSSAASMARGIGTFLGDVVPGIAPSLLEAAAAATSWEGEEPALLDLVGAVAADPPVGRRRAGEAAT